MSPIIGGGEAPRPGMRQAINSMARNKIGILGSFEVLLCNEMRAARCPIVEASRTPEAEGCPDGYTIYIYPYTKDVESCVEEGSPPADSIRIGRQLLEKFIDIMVHCRITIGGAFVGREGLRREIERVIYDNRDIAEATSLYLSDAARVRIGEETTYTVFSCIIPLLLPTLDTTNLRAVVSNNPAASLIPAAAVAVDALQGRLASWEPGSEAARKAARELAGEVVDIIMYYWRLAEAGRLRSTIYYSIDPRAAIVMGVLAGACLRADEMAEVGCPALLEGVREAAGRTGGGGAPQLAREIDEVFRELDTIVNKHSDMPVAPLSLPIYVADSSGFGIDVSVIFTALYEGFTWPRGGGGAGVI